MPSLPGAVAAAGNLVIMSQLNLSHVVAALLRDGRGLIVFSFA